MGPFRKLRAVSIRSPVPFSSENITDPKVPPRSMWVAIFQQWARSCSSLEHLMLNCDPRDVIRALPAFEKMSRLWLVIPTTRQDMSATQVLEDLADCSTSLPALESIRLAIESGSVELAPSLQRCLTAFPVTGVTIGSLRRRGWVSPWASDVARIAWPSTCWSVCLDIALSGEDLCNLAEQLGSQWCPLPFFFLVMGSLIK